MHIVSSEKRLSRLLIEQQWTMAALLTAQRREVTPEIELILAVNL